MEKRSLKVGDIVKTERGDVYCITNLNAFGPTEFINSSVGRFHVSALNDKGILRSIHVDSIVEILEHTDLVDEMLKRINRAILYGDRLSEVKYS